MFRFKNYRKRLIVGCVSLLVLLASCSGKLKERQKSEWLEKEVASKIIAHRNKKMTECKQDILLEVETFVDSLISNSDLFSKIIDENIPEKPSKPEYVPLDSSALREHRVNPILNG